MISPSCAILPSALSWDLFGGDWAAYKEALYKVFKRDFIDNQPSFLGKPVDIIHEQFFEGKERSFWHIITAGDRDIDREPDEERCARISWVKPLLEDGGNCPDYAMWIKWHDKTKRDRYYIWCRKDNYIVILEDRKTHFKLITAYYVQYAVKQYEKDYNQYLKTKTPT